MSRDIFYHKRDSYGFLKGSTFAVTLIALLIALGGSKSVFDLVLFVIAIMGAGFASLLVVRVFHWPITEKTAMMMMIGGLVAAVLWRLAGWHVHVFDTLPGMVTAFVLYFGWWIFTEKKKYK